MVAELGALVNRQRLVYWSPGLAAGLIAWVAFLTLGQTSLIRASGLALIIMGATMMLHRSGPVLATTGGLSLAFSPAFWSQTGGADSLSLEGMVVVLVAAGLVAVVFIRLSERPYLGLAVGLLIFAALFWTQLATLRSLRLNTLATAWLLYLLIDALYITNPRPDEAAPVRLKPRYQIGLLVLMVVGVINDPLFTLLVPAVLLGLWLSYVRLPGWYWLVIAGVVAYGLYGLTVEYVISTWWVYPSAQAEAIGLRVPYIMADGWREASRWLYLVDLVVGQFTVFGVVLGVLGVSRLARWYPPLGVVTMVAYATYALFGLVYFGRDSAVLLLPLLMIQVYWMTYAVKALGDWLQRSFASPHRALYWVAPAAYMLLPALLILRITGTL